MRIKNLLITDDHAFVIEGIIAELKEAFTIKNITKCHSPKEAIEKVKTNKFDLCILDLGFRAEEFNTNIKQLGYIKEIISLDPLTKIIIFTMREDFITISLLSKLPQVKGIVLKGPEKRHLKEAVDIVLRGGNYHCSRFKDLHERSESFRKTLKAKSEGLTVTEMRILLMIAKGLTSEAIAQELNYKPSTIMSYPSRFKAKAKC